MKKRKNVREKLRIADENLSCVNKLIEHSFIGSSVKCTHSPYFSFREVTRKKNKEKRKVKNSLEAIK